MFQDNIYQELIFLNTREDIKFFRVEEGGGCLSLRNLNIPGRGGHSPLPPWSAHPHVQNYYEAICVSDACVDLYI